jgi:uncharacterized protein
MLTHTFQHIQGINPYLEMYLWKKGVLTWDDYLSLRKPPLLSVFFHDKIKRQVLASQEALKKEDLGYFARKLPAHLYWRLFEQFRKDVVYFDVEATGLDLHQDVITVIGIYNGSLTKSFYRSCNLEEARSILSESVFWVTYNGSYFDVPFLKYSFNLNVPCVHLDLRKDFNRLGISGMLKSLEGLLGYEREGPLKCLDGFTAVILWHEFASGNEDALRLLLRYNMEDVVNLENLMIHAYNLNLQGTPFTLEKISYSPKPILDEDWDRDLARRIGSISKNKKFLQDFL